MNEQINIETNGDTREIIVRKGVALEPVAINEVSASGNLEAPRKFYEKFKSLVTEFETVVYVNLLSRSISLHIGWNHPHERTITGQLLFDPNFAKLGINSENTLTKDEMLKLLKFSRRFFDSSEEYNAILNGLGKLDSVFTLRMSQHNDNKGNKKDLFEQTLDEINLVDEFGLTIPIVLGGEKKTFRVELNMDLDGKVIRFWMESVTADEYIHDIAEDQIQANIQAFEEDPNIAVIYR